MYTIWVRVTEADDKKLLKELSPIFIWPIIVLSNLFLPTEALTGLLLIITFLSIVPIAIIVYKRTAPFRHQVYRSTILTFDVIDEKAFMNGQEVRITMNQEAQFIINIRALYNYAVDKRDTKVFYEFLETNQIPYIRLTGKNLKVKGIPLYNSAFEWIFSNRK